MFKRRLLPVLPWLSRTNVSIHEVFHPLIDPVSDSLQRRTLHVDDVLIASYPRSGNTWLRFLLFEIFTGRSGEYAEVRRAIPFVNYQHSAEPLLPDDGRLIKTHEPFHGAYEGKRAIYLVRDARDVAISEHRYRLRNGSYRGDLDAFTEVFVKGRAQRFGSWSRHVESWLESGSARGGRVLIVKFENLRGDTEGTLAAIVEFLGIDRGPEEIAAAVKNNSVENMRAKEDRTIRDPSKESAIIFRPVRSDLRFINQGAVGGWRGRLTEGQIRTIERACGPMLSRLGYHVEGLRVSL